jgi:hypothetical protein
MEALKSFEVSITMHHQTQPNMSHDCSLDYKIFQNFVVVEICSYYYRKRLFEKFFNTVNIWRIKVKSK